MKKNIFKSWLALAGIGAAALGLAGCCSPKKVNATNSSFTVYAVPVVTSGSNTTCHCAFVGCVTYVTNSSGWKPVAGVAHTAADGGGRTNTVVYYLGRLGDTGCGQTSVTVPTPAPSPYYRFVIYFPDNVPTTNYPITLTGFNP